MLYIDILNRMGSSADDTRPPDERSASWRPEFTRSTSSDNWRYNTRQTEDDKGRWKRLPMSRDRGSK